MRRKTTSIGSRYSFCISCPRIEVQPASPYTRVALSTAKWKGNAMAMKAAGASVASAIPYLSSSLCSGMNARLRSENRSACHRTSSVRWPLETLSACRVT